ncbi:hypothetical protein STENM223S_10907 [Streptomyces tendae]
MPGVRVEGLGAGFVGAQGAVRASGRWRVTGAISRDVEAAALGGGAQAQFGELDAAGSGQQVPVVGGVGVDVACRNSSHWALKPLSNSPLSGHLLPLVAEDLGGGDVRVPDRLRGGRAVLDAAAPQARDRGALGAVDLELHQFVAVDAHRPGGVDLGDRAALQLEDAVGGVVGGGVVGLAVLVPALRDVGGGEGLHGRHPAEQLVEHVLPVREHVDDDAAAVLRAVVPRRALRLLPVALEDPVPELAPHGQDPAEEPPSTRRFSLSRPGGTACPGRRRAGRRPRSPGGPVPGRRRDRWRWASRCRRACRRRSPS